MSTIQSFNQMNSISYDQRSMRQHTSFLPSYTNSFPTSYSTGVSYSFTTNRQYTNNPAIDGLRQRLFRRQQKPPEYRPVKVKRTEWMTVNMVNTASMLNQPSKRSPRVNPSYSQPMYQPYVGPLHAPPFQYNYAWQPSYSLPLPPPLPPVISFDFANHFQPYAYTSPIFPTIPNWQPLQPILPSYPSIFQTSAVPQYYNYSQTYYSNTSQVSSRQPVANNISISQRTYGSLEIPPGGILIMDEYIDKHHVHREKHHRRKKHNRTKHSSKHAERSTISDTNHTDLVQSNELTGTLPKVRNRQFFDYPKNTTSSRSVHTLSTDTTARPAEKFLTSIERHESVKLPSNSDTLRDIRLSLAIQDNQLDQTPIIRNISTKGNEEKPNSSIQSQTTKTISIVDSDITKQSFSTIPPRSHSTRDTNLDSISLASTFKSQKDQGTYLSNTNVF